MRDRVRASLSVSWKEGIPANMMLSIMDYYLVPYALFLGATSLQVGFVVAVPHLLGSFSQLLAVRIIGLSGSRLRFLVGGGRLQAAFLVPLAALVLVEARYRVPLLVALAAVFRVVMQLMGTAWGSLMSDYLGAGERGRYLGWRSRIVGLAGVGGLVYAGTLLHLFEGFSPALGFSLLFLSAAGCRYLSSRMMGKMADLPSRRDPRADFTFFMFLGRLGESNFVKFVLYAAGITFATQMAAPYFIVYMLQDLSLSYGGYTAVHLASVVGGLLAFPLWGKHADRVGNVKVLKTAGALVPVVPLLWIAGSSLPYLLAVELFAGFVWSGFTLSAANFVYDAVQPEKRVRCLGYVNFLNGAALFGGASLGGYLAGALPPLMGHRILSLLLLSALMRGVVHLGLSRNFHEVRGGVQKVSSADLFLSVLGVRPILGRNRELNVVPSLGGGEGEEEGRRMFDNDAGVS